MRLSPRGLSDGAHGVQLLATDVDGQATLSAPAKLRVDGQPPEVTARLVSGDRVRVSIRDRASGVAVAATRVNFGDGHRAHGHKQFVHRYGRRGLYRIVAYMRDRVGNQGVVRRLVSVP
jgi:hypothetical protein